MIVREDRPLVWRDRLTLYLHLLACKACPRFERQMLTMRNQLKEWRNYTSSE